MYVPVSSVDLFSHLRKKVISVQISSKCGTTPEHRYYTHECVLRWYKCMTDKDNAKNF